MSNDYYNHGSTPVQRSTLSSALIRAEFDLVTAGFAKLPTLTGNAYKLVVVDPTGAFLTVPSWGIYGGGNFTSNAAYGLNALSANVIGTSNTAIGSQTLTNATVSHNTGVGCQVMTAAVGADNTAVGAFAYNALTGSKNTALGYNVGTDRTTGTDNVEIGYNAVGNATATGSDNVVIGSNAGANFTSANKNTLVGRTAGQAIVTGAGNSAFGYLAALTYTGDGITAVGHQAAKVTTGVSVTSVGYNSLLANTTGAYNTALGESALFTTSTPDSMTAVGAWALKLATAGPNSAFGAFALSKNSTGVRNTSVGNVSMLECTIGTDNVAVGDSAGATITDGIRNTIVGALADVTSASTQNATAIGYQAVATASNQVVLGNSSVTQVVTEGRLAIGASVVKDYETAYSAAGAKSLFAASNTAGQASQALAQFNDAATAASINFVKGRGTAAAGTIVQNADALGGLYFYGAASASALGLGASIIASVDGTPGAVNDMPGAIAVSASADGSTTPALIATFSGANRSLKMNGSIALNGRFTLNAATYTVAQTDSVLIVNFAGTCTLTFPSAVTYAGRVLHIKTVTANPVVSASADVVPRAGGAASTAILSGVAGNWAMLISNGTNWEILASN